MSGAAQATAELLRRATEGRQSVVDALDTYRAADAALRGVDDVVDALRATATLILAAEALADVATRQARDARNVLAETMATTGATQVRTESHVVAVREGSRIVDVFEPKTIPPRYMRQPPAAPDKAQIAADLKAGVDVPGARLSNGGPHVVSFHKAAST